MVKQIYLLTQSFPADERFGLTQQIRRAAVSVPSNIAEGSGRGTNADFSHFLDIAYGSSCEVETQLYLSLDLEFISQQKFDTANNMLQDIQKLICNFQKSLQK
jgi:four helix bundle protein